MKRIDPRYKVDRQSGKAINKLGKSQGMLSKFGRLPKLYDLTPCYLIGRHEKFSCLSRFSEFLFLKWKNLCFDLMLFNDKYSVGNHMRPPRNVKNLFSRAISMRWCKASVICASVCDFEELVRIRNDFVLQGFFVSSN